MAWAIALALAGAACLGPYPSGSPAGSTGFPSVGSPAPAAPGGPIEPTGPTTTAEVVRVIDGDTIDVVVGGERRRVRYIGIDTPEFATGDPAIEALAAAASEANRALVTGRTVILESDVSQTDRFGRLLRYVWIETGGRWTQVNRELVARGLAEARSYPPDLRWQDALDAAETEAREAGRGRWQPGG